MKFYGGRCGLHKQFCPLKIDVARISSIVTCNYDIGLYNMINIVDVDEDS